MIPCGTSRVQVSFVYICLFREGMTDGNHVLCFSGSIVLRERNMEVRLRIHHSKSKAYFHHNSFIGSPTYI